jgi:hypothetical protein
MSLRIIISTVPHSKQRYETIGDWTYLENGDLNIVISNLGDWRKEALIAIHELIESLLCKARNITPEQVDRFDLQYEKDRLPTDSVSEPGDSMDAPYHKEHFFATSIERMLAGELNVEWFDYEESIYRLSNSD